MRKFEVCILSKEYRWVQVEAEDEGKAKNIAFDMVVELGYCGDTNPEHVGLEIYIEEEITEENEDA